jgi:hypothetical protein
MHWIGSVSAPVMPPGATVEGLPVRQGVKSGGATVILRSSIATSRSFLPAFSSSQLKWSVPVTKRPLV